MKKGRKEGGKIERKKKERGEELQALWVRQGGPLLLFTVLIPCTTLLEWLTPQRHMEANAGH